MKRRFLALSALLVSACAGETPYETEVRIDPLSELVVPHENDDIVDLAAARELREFLDTHPDRGDAARHAQRLKLYHREGLRAVARSAEDRAMHAVELGLLERRDGKYREAILAWEQAAGLLMASDPLLEELRALAAEAYLQDGDPATTLDLCMLSFSDELAGTTDAEALAVLRDRIERTNTE